MSATQELALADFITVENVERGSPFPLVCSNPTGFYLYHKNTSAKPQPPSKKTAWHALSLSDTPAGRPALIFVFCCVCSTHAPGADVAVGNRNLFLDRFAVFGARFTSPASQAPGRSKISSTF